MGVGWSSVSASNMIQVFREILATWSLGELGEILISTSNVFVG